MGVWLFCQQVRGGWWWSLISPPGWRFWHIRYAQMKYSHPIQNWPIWTTTRHALSLCKILLKKWCRSSWSWWHMLDPGAVHLKQRMTIFGGYSEKLEGLCNCIDPAPAYVFSPDWLQSETLHYQRVRCLLRDAEECFPSLDAAFLWRVEYFDGREENQQIYPTWCWTGIIIAAQVRVEDHLYGF